MTSEYSPIDYVVEFERLTVGALAHRPDLLLELDLRDEDFSQESYRLAYRAIAALHNAREAVDVITIAEYMEQSLGVAYPLPTIGDAMQYCGTPANGPAYAAKVKAASVARHARAIAAELAENADRGQDAIDFAVKALTDLSKVRSGRDRDQHVKEALRDFIGRVEYFAEKDGLPGIPSGINSLDRVMGGFHDSNLIVVAARTSVGKTAFLCNIALAVQEPVGIISAEQPAEQIAGRMIAIHGRVHAARLRNGRLLDEEWPRVTSAVQNLTNLGMRLDDTPAPSIAHVARRARSWKHRFGICALYVDYLQRLTGTDRRASRYEQVSEVALGLKEIARELEIPVIALAQVGRQAEHREDKRPMLSDLRESGSIEMEADAVLTLYRPEMHSDSARDQGIVEIQVLKNRHGQTGFVRARWQPEYMLFSDLEAA